MLTDRRFTNPQRHDRKRACTHKQQAKTCADKSHVQINLDRSRRFAALVHGLIAKGLALSHQRAVCCVCGGSKYIARSIQVCNPRHGQSLICPTCAIECPGVAVGVYMGAGGWPLNRSRVETCITAGPWRSSWDPGGSVACSWSLRVPKRRFPPDRDVRSSHNRRKTAELCCFRVTAWAESIRYTNYSRPPQTVQATHY